ncbi:MAG: hypothetical protein WB821_01165, partial [Burkholderiaceae bacterium]
MPPSIDPNVIDELVETLTTNSQMLLGASKLSGRDKEDSRDLPVREILKRSSEFSRACAVLGREDNATALSILT